MRGPQLITHDLAHALHLAIDRGQIVNHYQPQVCAVSGAIAGVECLVRWRHPEMGLLPASDFVSALTDDADLVERIGYAVLRSACRDAACWADLPVAINISPIQFRSPELVSRVVRIAAEEGLSLDRLELEILETAYFENPMRMREALIELRSRGVRIAIDDFGTGYSSLAALLELPLDKLKIDSGFVKQFDNLRSASIIHAIVALARAIGLKVTAEGVETLQQQRFLRAAGCHYLQGFLFAEAVPAAQITRMLEKDRRNQSRA